jgi:streptomycin 6-kinase
LTLGEPFEDGFASVVVQAAMTAGGEDAVLKVQDPHRESEHEAAALELWDGDGAIRLIAHDPERHALLLERCVPGTPLSSADRDEALGVFVELLPRLWKPAGPPFRPLAEEAAWWAENLPAEWEANGRPCERRLLDAALAALHDLAPTQGEQVLLHQDLHGDNVLAAQREPWLVIDPKPLAGEREFGLAPIVRSFELGHSKRDVLRRLDTLSFELGLDRERARGWAIGQTLAWAFGSTYHETHIETARWLAEAG